MNATYSILEAGYFDWLYGSMCDDILAKDISYLKLFSKMNSIEFIAKHPRDDNRIEDGLDLRYRYYSMMDEPTRYEINEPCSVLEVIVALAIKCEEHITDDPYIGDRTGQWFWKMISNLGLNGMYDDVYDGEYVEKCIYRFIDREYEPNGRGGLFYIEGIEEDLRDVEIWVQLLWYLNKYVYQLEV